MADIVDISDLNGWDGFVDGNGYSDMYGSALEHIEDLYNRYKSDALEDRAYNAMREDTAIQRYVKDAEAAGFNKLVALQGLTGSSSQPFSSISTAGSKARELIANIFQSLFSHNMDNVKEAESMSRILKNIAGAFTGVFGLF